jgi:hypothetical protein
MERMVSISNSWHVFWGINHFCIVGCQEVWRVRAFDSLCWVVQVEPSSALPCWFVVIPCFLFVRLVTSVASSLQFALNETVCVSLMVVRGGWHCSNKNQYS